MPPWHFTFLTSYEIWNMFKWSLHHQFDQTVLVLIQHSIGYLNIHMNNRNTTCILNLVLNLVNGWNCSLTNCYECEILQCELHLFIMYFSQWYNALYQVLQCNCWEGKKDLALPKENDNLLQCNHLFDYHKSFIQF